MNREIWAFLTYPAAHLLTALALFGCAGCAQRADLPEAVVNVGNRSEVQDLDPHLVVGVAEHRVLSALFQGLTDLDYATLEPIPGAAESWTVSGDGKVYSFRLRENGRWSNGDPVTAHDFHYSWRRMLSPELGAEYSYLLHCIRNARAYNAGELTDFSQVGVRVADDLTLEVTLENPTPYFLSMQVHFAWYPVHRGTIEKFGTMTQRGSAWTRTGNHVSNGPFRLLEWRPDEVLKSVRNEYYWDAGSVGIEGLNFFPIADELTEERSFRDGRLHMTYTVPMHKVENYRRENPELIHIGPYLGTYFYRFNVTRPPFDDVRVRRAFGMAVDREGLAREVLKAGEPAAYSFTPPDTAGYTCRHRVPEGTEAARALLAEAGYPEGAGLPPIDLLYNSAQSDKLIAEAMQQMWKERLGANVVLRNQDYKIYLDSMSQLDYQIARSIWIGDVMDPMNFLECFLSDSGNNRTGFNSPEYDGLIRDAYAEADSEKRNELLQRAEQLLLEEAVITPVYFHTQRYLKSPRLLGVTPNVLGQFRWQDFHFAPAER